MTAKDSRGNTVSATKTITCYQYYSPYFIDFVTYRANQKGQIDLSGTYLKCEYTTNIASVNGKNARTISIIGVGSDPISASGDGILIDLNGDKDTTYKVYAIVNDLFGGTAPSVTNTVFGDSRIINVTPDGTGIALGKKAENTELFECRWDAKFDGTATGPYGFSTSSDKRVKKNIKNLDIDIIDQLQSVEYQLINSDDKIHYGFIAQDVIQTLLNTGIDPDTCGIVGTVPKGKDQQYVLSYTEFVPLLVNKCQTLQSEVNELRHEMAEIKKLIV